MGGPPVCALARQSRCARSAVAGGSGARHARRPGVARRGGVSDDRHEGRRALPAARAGLDSRAQRPHVRDGRRAPRRLVPDTRHFQSAVRGRRPQPVRARVSAGEHDRRATRLPHPLCERARSQLVRGELRADGARDRGGDRLPRALARRALPSVRTARRPARHRRGRTRSLAAADRRCAYRVEHARP